MIEVIINNKKIDLYKDENIQVDDSIQNVKEIGKIFTTFSRTFSVPASKRNNNIFKNFYNFDIIDGFDPREKVRSVITKNGATWRKGFIQIENVKLKNNKPSSYKIYFTGEISELKDKFKEDRLSDLLELSAYDHSYTQANVETGFSSYTSVDGSGDLQEDNTNKDICYPFISVGSRYSYNINQELKQIDENGGYSGNNLEYRDLKPAIRLTRIIEAIEQKYDIEFSFDFFATDDFTGLYLWLNRTEGQLEDNPVINQNLFISAFNTTFPNLLNVFRIWNGTILTSPSRSYTLDYTINVPSIISLEFFVINNLTDEVLKAESYPFVNDSYSFSVTLEVPPGKTDSIDFEPFLKITGRSINPVNLTVDLQISELDEGVSTTDNGTVSTSVSTQVIIQNEVPKMKVIDFLTSVFKTFNLTAQVVDNVIEVKALNNFYKTGREIDINKNVNVEDITVSRVETINEFNFEFNQSESILIQERNKRVDDEFGNLDYILEDNDPSKQLGGVKFDIKSEFYKILFERLTLPNGDLTDTVFSWYVDEKQEPLSDEPIIFYTDKKPANGIKFQGGGGFEPGAYIAGLNSVGLNTINFGIEFNEFDLQPNTLSLFNKFYSNYVTSVFNPNVRKIKLEAILRDDFILNFKLNDTLIYKNRRFIINDININLNNNKAKLTLLNKVEGTETLILSTNNIATSFAAQTIKFFIVSNNTWSITVDQPWLSVNPTAGFQNEFISVIFQQNDTGAFRNATITVSTENLTEVIAVSQAPLPTQ